MSKRSSSRYSKRKPASSPQGLQKSPNQAAVAFDPERFKRSPHRLALLVLVSILLIAGAVVGLMLLANSMDLFGRRDVADKNLNDPQKRICENFRRLKNAGDPAAGDLLAPLPSQPEGPISEAEASRFQVDCFLRQDIRIGAVRRDKQGRLILVAQGNVSAPTLEVRNGDKVDRLQRTMANPNLIVEVRDGKIYGIGAEMNAD